MTTYESEIEFIDQNQEDVFALLSDLKNLEKAKANKQVTDEKVAAYVQNFSFDSDSVQLSVTGIGDLGFRIIEREPSKTIKLETENSPLSANAWIQLVSAGENQTKMKITLKVDLPMMVKMMLNDKLQKGVNKIAETIAKAINEGI